MSTYATNAELDKLFDIDAQLLTNSIAQFDGEIVNQLLRKRWLMRHGHRFLISVLGKAQMHKAICGDYPIAKKMLDAPSLTAPLFGAVAAVTVDDATMQTYGH